jgi:enolase
MAVIQSVQGREILDSRGNPTVEVEIILEDGTKAAAGVPSGASTGAHEAWELRDGDARRYGGQGVLRAVENVNGPIRELLVGMDSADQREVDQALIALDGTENKSRLGANAILGASLAAARATALSQGLPLYAYLRNLIKRKKDAPFPIPMFNIVNGGKHSDSGLSIQEFKLIPAGIPTFREALRAGSEVFHALQSILIRRGQAVGVGDEGGFAPHLDNHTQALEVIAEAIRTAGYRLGTDVFIGLDVAANSFYLVEEDSYLLKPENVKLSRESLINLYRGWMKDFSLVSIEDGLHEEDFSGWAAMAEKIGREPAAWGQPALLVGDDLLVTNVGRLKQAIAAKACNAVLIKVNQIGTLTETIECITLAHKEKMACMISHRSGETTDDFIADLAVGAGARYIKSGSLSRGERIVKYNRLLAIARELGQAE